VPLIFALDYAIRKVQEIWVGPKLNATYKLFAYIDEVKTKHMLLSHHQNVGQNHDIKIINRPFENVAQLKYLATNETNKI
jgi:hypothetical protein